MHLPVKLLLIEDEKDVAERCASALRGFGHVVVVANDLMHASECIVSERPDLIILDRLVGERDAIGHITTWRPITTAPVLVLTSMTQVGDRIHGLNSGADDYLLKPADPGEIDARVRALLRRHGPAQAAEVISNGPLVIDRMRREARVRDRLLPLQPREFRLLEELALCVGDVVSRRTLLKAVWDLNFEPRTKLLEVHVSRLRTKLRDAAAANLIETVRGNGYRMGAWPDGT